MKSRMTKHLATLCLIITSVVGIPQPTTPVSSYTQLTSDQVKHLQNRGFGSTIKSFRPTSAYIEEEDDEIYDDALDNEPEPSQDRVPTYVNQNYPIQLKTTLHPNQNYPIPIRTTAKAYPTQAPKYERRPIQQQQQQQEQRQQQQYLRRGEEINRLEEEKEEEEPDRLSLLLPQSKFNCNGKNTGYYADEDLACEVFHYCHENAKHSWICPEGFTFHQVHLICMPPGGDNICDKSSAFHFVNEYLYKPLNLEEHQQRPNITLRYSDRYYPEQYRQRYEDDEEEEAPVHHHQHSVRVTQQRPKFVSPTTLRPQLSHGQVFRSPEEINISLQQRRPVQYQTEY